SQEPLYPPAAGVSKTHHSQGEEMNLLLLCYRPALQATVIPFEEWAAQVKGKCEALEKIQSQLDISPAFP
ncbi:MAG: hypothetical protein KDK60_03095, partial [Chlamydiia bacterium]|nr:hypothetical protein [Chlamydiia bacterium]